MSRKCSARKNRGRRERYRSMREDGNESGYQNLGDGVRRENTGKTKGTAASSKVRELRPGGMARPALTEGYRRKERNITGEHIYQSVYVEGMTEPAIRKRPVGTKMLRGEIGRPNARGKKTVIPLWNLLDRERITVFLAKEGSREGKKGETRNVRRRRRKRTQDFYESSIEQRVDAGEVLDRLKAEEEEEERVDGGEVLERSQAKREEIKVMEEILNGGGIEQAAGYREVYEVEQSWREQILEGKPWLKEASVVHNRRKDAMETTEGKGKGTGRTVAVGVYRKGDGENSGSRGV
jgi:hypothetical protein